VISRDTESLGTPGNLSCSNVQVDVDWSFTTSSTFTGESAPFKYVKTIDSVAALSKNILMTGSSNWGSQSLVAMKKASASVASKLSTLKAIRISFDTNNSSSKRYGKTRSLNPDCFVVSTDGSTLNVLLNYSLIGSSLPGIGRVVRLHMVIIGSIRLVRE